MKSLAEENGLDIYFYDSISNEELYELYDIADIAIFVPESEPWGIFPLETILGEIPTIISDQCGVKDISLTHYPIVKTGDIQKLAEIILDVRNNYGKYKNITHKTSKMISKNYSWEAYSKRMENIFCEFIKNNI